MERRGKERRGDIQSLREHIREMKRAEMRRRRTEGSRGQTEGMVDDRREKGQE